jgi:hypothetical protein
MLQLFPCQANFIIQNCVQLCNACLWQILKDKNSRTEAWQRRLNKCLLWYKSSVYSQYLLPRQAMAMLSDIAPLCSDRGIIESSHSLFSPCQTLDIFAPTAQNDGWHLLYESDAVTFEFFALFCPETGE